MGVSFVVQVTWVVILRTRDGTSLVNQFKWRVHPFVKDFTRLKKISRIGVVA